MVRFFFLMAIPTLKVPLIRWKVGVRIWWSVLWFHSQTLLCCAGCIPVRLGLQTGCDLCIGSFRKVHSQGHPEDFAAALEPLCGSQVLLRPPAVPPYLRRRSCLSSPLTGQARSPVTGTAVRRCHFTLWASREPLTQRFALRFFSVLCKTECNYDSSSLKILLDYVASSPNRWAILAWSNLTNIVFNCKLLSTAAVIRPKGDSYQCLLPL